MNAPAERRSACQQLQCEVWLPKEQENESSLEVIVDNPNLDVDNDDRSQVSIDDNASVSSSGSESTCGFSEENSTSSAEDWGGKRMKKKHPSENYNF